MSGTVAVEPDPAHAAGHAIIRLRGAGQYTGRPDFRIRRTDYDEGVYGRNGWQVADTLLTPDAVTTEANDLLLHVGPSVVQHIVSGIYQVSIPGAKLENSVYWPDLPLLPDDALNMVAAPAVTDDRTVIMPRPKIERPAPRLPPEAVLQVVPSSTGPVGTAEPDPDDTLKMRLLKGGLPPKPAPLPPIDPPPEPVGWVFPLLGLLALFLVIGAAGYYEYDWLRSLITGTEKKSDPIAIVPPPQLPSGPSQPAAAPGRDLTRMSAAELAASGASPEQVFHEAERRMKLGAAGRNEALPLMRESARRGYAPANGALGKIYDTRVPRPPDIPTEIPADARQAACYYRDAIQGGDNSVADARADLRKRLEASVNADRYARPILNECWP